MVTLSPAPALRKAERELFLRNRNRQHIFEKFFKELKDFRLRLNLKIRKLNFPECFVEKL